MQPYAAATHEELWSHGVLLETRTSSGSITESGSEFLAISSCPELLVRRADEQVRALQPFVSKLRHARVRIVASARQSGGLERADTTLTVAMQGLSVVTTPESLEDDAAYLASICNHQPEKAVDLSLPMVWSGGSAAVLLHEAIGHAAEHNQFPVSFPHWLTVRDEPLVERDDDGRPTEQTDLLKRGPLFMRRESFRDISIPRMSNLVARQIGAPFSLPNAYVDVQLLDGGAYDPLYGLATLHIAVAFEVCGKQRTPLHPFSMKRTRQMIVESIAGGIGSPLRYPGVICSREGQELLVTSHAPVLITG